jgi:hypothetical protein
VSNVCFFADFNVKAQMTTIIVLVKNYGSLVKNVVQNGKCDISIANYVIIK